MIDRHTPVECLSPPLSDALPEQCQQLKRGFRECKRGMVDMRKRFRGNQPISVSAELEGGTEMLVGGQKVQGVNKPQQMYGGKEAFGPPVKEEGRGMSTELGFDPENTRGL